MDSAVHVFGDRSRCVKKRVDEEITFEWVGTDVSGLISAGNWSSPPDEHQTHFLRCGFLRLYVVLLVLLVSHGTEAMTKQGKFQMRSTFAKQGLYFRSLFRFIMAI